jgi:MFS family permease
MRVSDDEMERPATAAPRMEEDPFAATLPKRRYGIYALVCAMTAINFLDRASLSVAAPAVAASLGLTAVAQGYLLSAYSWTYLLCLLPASIVLDRIGTRRMAAYSISLWSFASMLTGFAGSYAMLFATRLLLGVGEAPSNPTCSRVVREWAPVRERGFASAAYNTGGYIGPAIASILVSALVTALGWHLAFVITGALGFVWLAVWLWKFRQPEHAPWLTPDERAYIVANRDATTPDPGRRDQASILGLLRYPAMWGVALSQGCGVYSHYFFLTWLPSYMVHDRHMTLLKGGLLSSVPYLCATVFGLLIAALVDRLLKGNAAHRGARRYAVVALFAIATVLFAAPSTRSTAMVIVLICIAMTSVATALSMNVALVNDLLRVGSATGRAYGILNFGGNVGGIFAPIVTGYVVGASGNYALAFVVSGGVLVLGALSSLLLTHRPIGSATTAA